MRIKLLIVTLLSFPIISCAQPALEGIEIVNNLKMSPSADNFFDNNYPQSLMSMGKSIPVYGLKLAASNTRVRASSKDIPTNNTFNRICTDRENVSYGFAPLGTFKDNHWTGIKEYFHNKALGMCEYSQLVIRYMKIERSIIQQDVNGKMTVVSIDGNEQSGYLYTVNWYNENNDKTITEFTIDCAMKAKNDNAVKQIIALAKSVDHM